MMDSPELPPLTPELYGEGPAREPHVDVVDRWVECRNLGPDDEEHSDEFLHRQLNEEANVLENAASSLVDFPDADWGIRMWLARQCADEARHCLAYLRILRDRRISFGRYPVMNFQFRVLQRIDSLIGRLAVQNRTFEADGLDAVTFALDQARKRGQEELAVLYDAQQADEVVHVGFANRWIKQRIADDPREALRMAAALTHGRRAFLEVFAGGGTDVSAYGVAAPERAMAGFDDGEIEVAARQSQERRDEVRRSAGRPGR